MRKRLVGVAVVAVVAAVSWHVWRGPSAEEILAAIEVPPAPVLSPEEALGAFRVAPGYRVELVAAEPLVVDPVAMDWDDEGRLYVVEMRGFMPNIDARGEARASGRIVVLEDVDFDGRMDRSGVFLDQLVMPRAVAVRPEGVLVGVPPDLWLCRDPAGQRRCTDKIRLHEYAIGDYDPEHMENALLGGIDGWIYNAASSRRFRFAPGADSLEVQDTARRGQWGIAQDDAGRLFYNHNSGFLYGDVFSADYAMRHPATATRIDKPGVNIPLADGETLYGIRVAPGLNRAYIEGTLRRDGRQAGPTAVSGLVLQRGHQFGAEALGDAFVPEAAGAALARFRIERTGTELRAEHQLFPDADWGEREFLASSDERFRPVDVKVGPDGALWVIDMHRGVIQHANYVSDYLRAYVAEHGLEAPGETGRIWRIVREDQPLDRRPPRLDDLSHQLAALDHANGWVRDRAQRGVVANGGEAATAALRRLDDFGALGRRHALFALEQMQALDAETWQRALRDPDPEVRLIGLRVGESLFHRDDIDAASRVALLLDDPDPAVRLQALHSLGSLPAAKRPVERLLAAGVDGDAVTVQGALSGLGGFELASLESELEAAGSGEPGDRLKGWIESLALAVHLAAQSGAEPATDVWRLLDTAQRREAEWQRIALLDGIDRAQDRPGSRRIELEAAHPIFESRRKLSDAEHIALARVRRHVTWPGDPAPGGARPLSSEETERRARGARLFAATCATCHGENGRGARGLAPSLVHSSWVRDSDDWLVRIVLDGISGPLRIDGEQWNLTMPGHRRDPRFDDDTLAGMLTHLRRSWGHADDPVAPASVARIRADTASRALPWTADELRNLDVEHRLDRYVGTYAVPVVGIELVIRRRGPELTLGRKRGAQGELLELGNGAFSAQGITIRFELDSSGISSGARLLMEGNEVPLSKRD